MRRSFVLIAALLALAVPLQAQQPPSYVVTLKITVAGSAVTFADAASSACTLNACLKSQDGHVQATVAVCTSTASGGTITFRIDGTTVTASTGQEVAPGSTFVITGNNWLLNTSFIRTGSTSGDLRCVVSG